MISPVTFALTAFALAAGGYAVAVGSSLEIQEAAATAAVILAILAAVSHYSSTAPRRHVDEIPVEFEPTLSPLGTDSIRSALAGGPFARESMVLTLDSIERRGLRPDLPSTPITEIRRITELSPEQFRSYVRGRIDRLENEL